MNKKTIITTLQKESILLALVAVAGQAQEVRIDTAWNRYQVPVPLTTTLGVTSCM